LPNDNGRPSDARPSLAVPWPPSIAKSAKNVSVAKDFLPEVKIILCHRTRGSITWGRGKGGEKEILAGVFMHRDVGSRGGPLRGECDVRA